MLTDSIVEEEFELKEEEPWYDKQDLEHDLQLAAELGKTLLERNRELEQGLQQMYSTNQEQLQEIEYLTKQVELLRQVNDQHAKVYEQLDMSARELEQSNHKLSQDNRASQQKIHGLVETVELLQTQVDELQHQVESMKLGPCQLRKPPGGERGPPRGAQSVSCLKELQNVDKYSECDPDESSKCSDLSWRKDEQASLRQSLRSLQVQFASERARREEAEREAELLTSEYAALEQQLAGLERCRARVSELECEAEELRQLWKSEGSSTCSRAVVPHSLLSNAIFLHPGEGGAEDEDEAEGYIRSPWGGEWTRKTTQPPVSPNHIEDHECSCVRRAEVVKYRGISLLNEVDAQYSALQVKYDELLRRCHLATPPLQQRRDEEDVQSHKAVQTFADSCPALTHTDDFEDDFHQPEYKELFREIFSRIRKTKEDLIQNRGRPSVSHVQPIVH